MRFGELLRRLLYFLSGRGPAEYKLLGVEGNEVRMTKSGGLIFGVWIRPYFKCVNVGIDVPGTDFIILIEGDGQQEAHGSVELEVCDEATVWLAAQEFAGHRVTITLSDGWLRKKITLGAVRSDV